MCNKLKKGLKESMDKILDKYEVSTKVFGHPVEDFDINDMSTAQMKSMKRLLIKKIDSYGR